MKLRRKRSSASFPFLEEWFLSCLLLDTRCANSEPGHKPLEGPTCGTVIFTHLLAWPFRIHVDSMIWLLIVLEVNRYYILWQSLTYHTGRSWGTRYSTFLQFVSALVFLWGCESSNCWNEAWSRLGMPWTYHFWCLGRWKGNDKQSLDGIQPKDLPAELQKVMHKGKATDFLFAHL